MFDVRCRCRGQPPTFNCGAQGGTTKFLYVPRFQAADGDRYPWAMAPTINATKLVATAIATFASMDKFIIFPFNYGGPMTPVFEFFLFLIVSNFGLLMDARTES